MTIANLRCMSEFKEKAAEMLIGKNKELEEVESLNISLESTKRHRERLLIEISLLNEIITK